MGNDTVLAEALSEDQHDLLVSLMKVTMIMWHPIYKLNIQCSCDISKEAEKLFADPVLSYWWSGLQDPDNDGVWTWMYCELSPTSTESNYVLLLRFQRVSRCLLAGAIGTL